MKRFITARDIGAERDRICREFEKTLNQFHGECDGVMVLSLGLQSTAGRYPSVPFKVQIELLID